MDGNPLRAAREARNWSIDTVAAKTGLSRRTVLRAEHGERLNPTTRRLLCECFGIEAEELGLGVRRRSSAASGGNATADEHWDLVETVTRASISHQTLDEIGREALAYSQNYPGLPPRMLLLPVSRLLAVIKAALSRPQRLSTQRRCLELLGVLAGISGDLYFDLDRKLVAANRLRAGATAAMEAENADLHAWILATQSIEPYFARRPAEAVRLLDQAEQLARCASSARRRAWIASLTARALAAVGDAEPAKAAIDGAQALLGQVVEPASGNDFVDQPRLDGMSGTTLLLLRDARAAASLIGRALTTRAAGDAKGKALLTLDLASCRVIEGEPDEAARLAENALSVAEGTMVVPIVARATQLRVELTPWEGRSSVTELDMRIADAARRDQAKE